jgi:hypothetical protein
MERQKLMRITERSERIYLEDEMERVRTGGRQRVLLTQKHVILLKCEIVVLLPGGTYFQTET